MWHLERDKGWRTKFGHPRYTGDTWDGMRSPQERIYPGLGRAKEGRPLSGLEKKEKASKTDGKAAASDMGKQHGCLKKYRERKK